jgi:hypothetical protein
VNAVRGDYMNLFTTFDVSVPSLKEAFLGTSLSAPALGSDPITAPFFAALEKTTAGPTQTGVTGTPPAVTSSSTPAPAPAPSSQPCPLLSALLGAC